MSPFQEEAWRAPCVPGTMLTLGFSIKQRKVSPVIMGPMVEEEGVSVWLDRAPEEQLSAAPEETED